MVTGLTFAMTHDGLHVLGVGSDGAVSFGVLAVRARRKLHVFRCWHFFLAF